MTEPTAPGSSSGKTFDVPKVGRVKRIYVYAGLAVVGVSAVLWYRNHNGTAGSSAGTATDPAGNVGQIDPATGFVYGSPQDVDALAAASGGGSGGSGGGGSSSGGGGVGDQVSNGPPFTDNAAWDQYATQWLTGVAGLDPGQVAHDLGAYLTGAQVTAAEADTTIRPAIGAAGPVPVAGPNGFPPSINIAGSVDHPGGGAPGPLSLSMGAVTDTSAVVKWTPVSGASSYGWSIAGTTRHGTVSEQSITLTALTPGTSYTVKVHGNGSGGTGPDASITFNTRAASGGGSTTPPSGSYAAVGVVEYTSKNPAWNSTVSGIARHYGYGSDWETVWNDPKNAPLRAKRGAPNLIRAGDTVYVKRK